ncbi:MAG: zinc-ribbon domain-containing protein [Actinomycetota bacterium]
MDTAEEDRRGSDLHGEARPGRAAAGGGEGNERHAGAGKRCPECGEPIDDVRKTCLGCGRELSSDDYENPGAGTEFRAGAAVDEEGNEVVDWDPEGEDGGPRTGAGRSGG